MQFTDYVILHVQLSFDGRQESIPNWLKDLVKMHNPKIKPKFQSVTWYDNNE